MANSGLIFLVALGTVLKLDGYVDGTPRWSLDGDPVTFQWFLNGQPIDANAGGNAHSPQLRTTKAQLEQELSASATVTPADAPAYTATSAVSSVNPSASVGRPAITGESRVGQTLTIDNGFWTTQADFWTYAWYRDGVVIPDAAAAVYTLTAADGGHAITAGVTWHSRTTAWTTEALSAAANVPAARVTVTFDANGGAGAVAPQERDYGTATALTASTLTREHYTFMGWNTAANGSGTPYANGAVAAFTGDATLFAQWLAATYTVTFNANGGTGTMPAQSKAYDGADAALTANAFTRAGFTFTGWNTAANGSGTAYSAGAAYAFMGPVTLYAQRTFSGCDSSSWSAEYFGGRVLAGSPLASQCLSELNEVFALGQSPLSVVPTQNYSARFSKTIDEGAGTYVFSFFHDDGVRIFVDGERVFTAWGSADGTVQKSASVQLGDGSHDVVVEYYQGGGSAKLVLEYEHLGVVARS